MKYASKNMVAISQSDQLFTIIEETGEITKE
jgi:hypothetical protein